MPDVALLPLLTATIAAFILGAAYYALLGRQLAEVSEASDIIYSAANENTPWRLAAIHAGDWLVKLLVVALIVS